jgi:hypothetical protein
MGLGGISIYSDCRIEIPPSSRHGDSGLILLVSLRCHHRFRPWLFLFCFLTAAAGTAFAALVRGETEVSDFSSSGYHARQVGARKATAQAVE